MTMRERLFGERVICAVIVLVGSALLVSSIVPNESVRILLAAFTAVASFDSIVYGQSMNNRIIGAIALVCLVAGIAVDRFLIGVIIASGVISVFLRTDLTNGKSV